MPRTFVATVGLIVTIVLLALLTIINLFQSNNTESTVLSLEKKVDALVASNEKILQKLEKGVSVNGAVVAGNHGGGKVDSYADAFSDPKNVLSPQTDIHVAKDAIYDGKIRQILSDTPKGYNWLTESSVDVANIQGLVHNQYGRRSFDNPDEYMSELAYKVIPSDDFLEYTVHLRKGVYWHVPNVDFSEKKYAWLKQPRELTSEDAVYFFDLLQNPQVEAGAKQAYEDLDHAEVIDKYTFKVVWKRKVYNSLDNTVQAFPLPKWLFTRDEAGNEIPKETMGLKFNSHWASKLALGTGPYRLTESKAGERVVLEANASYFRDGYPISRIDYSIVKDPEASYLKLKADEIDFIGGLAPPRYKSEIVDGKDSPFQKGELEYKIVDRFAYYYLGWNADGKFFGDKRVRLAMTHALNRPGIIKNVVQGLGSIQTGPFYYKHPGMDPSVVPYEFNIEKSKALLAEAGWEDTDGDGVRDKVIDGEKVDFEFNVMAYESPLWKSVLAVYKEELRKVGIKMTPQPVDWPTMQKKMDEKKFDAFTGGWGLSWAVDPYQLWHSTQADVPKGSNRVGFRNKEADQLIETLRVTFDSAERIKIMRQFHNILHEEQPYTFFFAPQSVAAWQPRLENVIINKIRPQYHPLPWHIDPSKTKAAK